MCPLAKKEMAYASPMPCPMMHQCPVMNQSMYQQGPYMENMPMEMDPYMEDEQDDKYFMGMCSDTTSKLMKHVVGTVDSMEAKGIDIYNGYPKTEMLNNMVDMTYKNAVADMPELEEEGEVQNNARQFGRRRFGRDLIALLLFNELFRRRRRRRRRHDYGNGGGYGGGYGDNYSNYGNYPYGDEDFYYNE